MSAFLRALSPELTQDELGKTVQTEANRVISLAHQRDRWLRPSEGEYPPDDQRFSIKAPTWASKLHFTYAVVAVPEARAKRVFVQRKHEAVEPEAEAVGFHIIRHLHIQLSVPDQSVTTAELNMHKADMLALYQPMVDAFFPLASHVGVNLMATEPIPVQRPGHGRDGKQTHVLGFRVPISANFTVPWSGSGTEPYKMTDAEFTELCLAVR